MKKPTTEPSEIEDLTMTIEGLREDLKYALSSRNYFIQELRVTEAHCKLLEEQLETALKRETMTTIYYTIPRDRIKITICKTEGTFEEVCQQAEGVRLLFPTLEGLSDYIDQQPLECQPAYFQAYFKATQEALSNGLYMDIKDTLTRSKPHD